MVALFFYSNFCKYYLFSRYRFMIVLGTTDQEQIVYVIPRIATTNIELSIVDDITGELLNDSSTSELYGDYLKISLLIDGLVKNRFYTFRIKNSDTLKNIYKDKIFVTDQVIDQINNKTYSINKDQYVKVESNNDYIVIWAEENQYRERLML